MVKQLTLALLKPDLVASSSRVRAILAELEGGGFGRPVFQKDVFWTREQAGQFYAEHKGRFFYSRLCGYMSSGPFVAMVLAREDAIKGWRALIGPTHPVRARINAPSSLRSRFGLTDTRNSFHGSDSIETAEKEIKFFFPEFDSKQWMEMQRPTACVDQNPALRP